MYPQKFICFALLLAVGLCLKAQQPVYKHYTSYEGLPHDITYQIIQDKTGYIWIGTDDGLAKFDGSRFTNYANQHGLASNYVVDVTEIDSNQFLIATWGGGLHVLQNDCIFKGDFLNDQNSKIRKVYALDDTVIYGAGNSNFHRYSVNTKSKKRYFVGECGPDLRLNHDQAYEADFVNVSMSESYINGNLYIHASPIPNAALNTVRDLYMLEGVALKRLNLPIAKDLEIHTVAETSKGLAIASHHQVFWVRENTLLDSVAINIVDERIIQMDMRHDLLYFVSLNVKDGSRKIYCYDLRTNQLENLSETLGINSFISDFMFDRDGGLWITTYGQGVYYLPYLLNQFFDKRTFKNPDLRDVDTVGNQLLLLAPNYCYVFGEGRLRETVALPHHTEAFQIDRPNRTLNLIAFRNHSRHLELNGFQLVYKPYPTFEFSHNDTMIRLVSGQVEVYHGEVLAQTHALPVRESYLKAAFQFKDTIYAICEKVGVFLIDAQTGKLIETWNKANGFYTNAFNDIAYDGAAVWLASDVGLIKVIGKQIKRYGTAEGLVSNHINDILIDSFAQLWVATAKGVNVLNGESIFTVGRELGQQSAFVSKLITYNQTLCAIGNNGLFLFPNNSIFKPDSQTQLFVEQTAARFSLKTINYTNAHSIKLAYQLNDGDWVTTQNPILDFSQIQAGTYHLKLRYKDNLSSWQYREGYQFTITLPWYKQAWIYSLFIGVLAITIILAIYHQLKRSREKNVMIATALREREVLQEKLDNVRHQIAQDFHDDLGNKLASVSILSQLAVQDLNKDNPLYSPLHQINKDANTLFLDMRDFIWSLDADHNRLLEVHLYLNDFGEQLFENTPINFKSLNNLPDTHDVLPHYWNKELVLTFKEAMTNALKHSKATDIVFESTIDQNQLKVMLSDNGVGFKVNDLPRINGLKNMEKRIASIGGTLTIDSGEKGTKVTFRTSIELLKKNTKA